MPVSDIEMLWSRHISGELDDRVLCERQRRAVIPINPIEIYDSVGYER